MLDAEIGAKLIELMLSRGLTLLPAKQLVGERLSVATPQRLQLKGFGVQGQ